MPAKPYRELLEDRQEKNFIVDKAWNRSNGNVGTANFVQKRKMFKENKQVYLFTLNTKKKCPL